MSKMKYLKVNLWVFLFFSFSFLNAQTNPKNLTGEMYCKNTDYQFLVEGRYYFENSKVYVCPKNIPLDVTIVDALDSQNPVLETIEWKINGIVSSDIDNTLVIGASEFINDEIILECKIIYTPTNTISLIINLYKNIELNFTEKDKNYQFDENDEMAYIGEVAYGETLGTPWNFIESGKFDILKAKVSKQRGYYAVDNIMTDNSLLNITPNLLSSASENITFEFTGTNQNIIEVRGCHDVDPELLIFTEDRKVFNIEFIKVCETDDDMQITSVGTMVTNATDVCIDGGFDLTIDEMRNPSFLIGDDYLYSDPSTGKVYVLAGLDLKCETPANPHPVGGRVDCPSNFNITSSINVANKILEKVAIKLNPPIIRSINFNYNIYSEDGLLEEREQNFLHMAYYGNNSANNIVVYLVDDLGTGVAGGLVQGKATGQGGHNTLAIDVNDATSNVLVHEIGHAKWRLEHPGCPCIPSYNGQFGINDKYNFMHGVSNEIIKWNVRRYQFNLMH